MRTPSEWVAYWETRRAAHFEHEKRFALFISEIQADAHKTGQGAMRERAVSAAKSRALSDPMKRWSEDRNQGYYDGAQDVQDEILALSIEEPASN